MFVNTRDNYITIGTSVTEDGDLNNKLSLPVPTEIPSSGEFFADAGRNADGTMIIQQIGRTQYTTQIRWASLDAKMWWKINRWFEEYGYVFWMKYFSHTDGRVKIHRFYRGNVEKGVPSTTTTIIDGICVPQKYKNCGFNVIDMGEDDVITAYEVDI